MSLAHLATVVRGEREHRRMSREQLAYQCDLSVSTIKNLEQPRHPHMVHNWRTRTAIEKAFNWASGSFLHVVQGGEPIRLPTPDTVENVPPVQSHTHSVPLYLEPGIRAAIDRIAVHELRNVNAILEDALNLYERLRGASALGQATT